MRTACLIAIAILVAGCISQTSTGQDANQNLQKRLILCGDWPEEDENHNDYAEKAYIIPNRTIPEWFPQNFPIPYDTIMVAQKSVPGRDTHSAIFCTSQSPPDLVSLYGNSSWNFILVENPNWKHYVIKGTGMIEGRRYEDVMVILFTEGRTVMINEFQGADNLP